MQFTRDMLTLGPDSYYRSQFTEPQPFPFGIERSIRVHQAEKEGIPCRGDQLCKGVELESGVAGAGT